MAQTEVIFCGKSLYISGLASGVQSGNTFRVAMLEASFAELFQEINMLHPDIIVYENDPEISGGYVQSFLDRYPRICLIEVRPEDDSLVVSCAQGSRTSKVSRLVSIMIENNLFPAYRAHHHSCDPEPVTEPGLEA